MAHKYFTSDLHFGSSVLLDKNAMGNDVRPFMSLDEIVKGLELALEACTLYNEDIKTIGGEIC